MEQLKCKKCGKIIEGFNKNHVEFLMLQHQLKHKREEARNNQKQMEDKSNEKSN